MTFVISKITWFLLQPLNLLLLLVLTGAVLAWTPWWRAGRRLVGVAALVTLLFAVLPTGPYMLAALEERFPRPEITGSLDGIVVLGGSIDPLVTAEHGQPALNDAAERLTEAVALLRRHPKASLVFTGGSGALLDQEVKEAPAAQALLRDLGVPVGRVVLEDQSRDTYENAVLTRDLVQPQPGERWLLITSAFHMPRAVGAFRAAGWDIVPYPVDYRLSEASFRIGFGQPLGAAHMALHEWLGLFFYRMAGRADALFPAPQAAPPLAPEGAAVAQHGVSLRRDTIR